MTDTTQQQTTDTSAAALAAGAGQTTLAPADAGKTGNAAKPAGKTADAAHGTTEGEGLKQEAAAEWYAGLPDDLKGEKAILRHANLEDAIRAGLGAEKRLGVPADQLVRLPTKPEEYAEVYKKLGAPETAEGYKIGLPDNATEADKALATKFGQFMFEKGPFPPDMVKAAVDFINGETLAGDEALATAQAERRAQGEALLKQELGSTYDPDMKAVGKLLNDLGGKELADEFDASGKGDNPRLMLALQKIVNERSEPGSLDGQGKSVGATGVTPGQAKAARLNLENDPVKGVALQDSSHSMHKSVVEERKRLIRIEHGQDPNGD